MWAGIAVSLLALTARLLIRWKLLNKLKADDWLAAAAMALFLVTTIIHTTVSRILYRQGAGGDYITSYDENYSRKITLLLRTQILSYMFTWTCLWTVKLSFLAFFRGLGQQLRFQRILWWGILALTLASYAVCVGLLNYKCFQREEGGR